MTTTARRRSAILAGLLLLALLTLAVSVTTSRAILPVGAGTGGASTVTPPTQAQAGVALLKHGQLDRVQSAVAPVATVTVAATGATSATTWIILAVALAALSIGVWALLRSRRRSRFAAPADDFCTLHPQDARCPVG